MSPRLAILVSGLVAFAVLHTLLASDGVRRRIEARLGSAARAYRLGYNIVAALFLAGVVAGTSGAHPVVWDARGPARAAFLAVQMVAVAGFLVALRGTDLGFFLGLRQMRGLGERGGFRTDGAYALCRHPLYFFAGLFFSAWPRMDARWLVVAVWVWAYAYVGSILEERKLVHAFGPAYRRYQRTHRRLLPLGPRRGAEPAATDAGR